MVKNNTLTASYYFKKAEKMLEEQDLIGFMECIGSAKPLIKNNTSLLSKLDFLKAKGLYLFNNFEDALPAIEKALETNSGEEFLKLQEYQGLIYKEQGKFDKSIVNFKKILEQIDNQESKVKFYINIGWVNLTGYEVENERKYLKEANKYLDLAEEVIEKRNSPHYKLLLLNYGDYYYKTGNYDKAIQFVERAVKYCNKEELPEIYNFLAEIHLAIDGVRLEEYLRKAEESAMKYDNDQELAQVYYTRSQLEDKNEEWLKAIDSLYIALQHFMEANDYARAFKCFSKIIELTKKFRDDCVISFDSSMKKYFNKESF